MYLYNVLEKAYRASKERQVKKGKINFNFLCGEREKVKRTFSQGKHAKE